MLLMDMYIKVDIDVVVFYTTVNLFHNHIYDIYHADFMAPLFYISTVHTSSKTICFFVYID